MDVLAKEIAGGDPVTVRIRGTERVLAYPMHAVILYKQLTGDSLFVKESFEKIDLASDPERWFKCLWAGLHQFDGVKWTVPVTIDELGALVDFSNASDLSVQMVKAILQAMPKPDPAKSKEADSKKELAPQPAAELTVPIPISASSTLALADDSDSAVSSS